MTTNTKSFDPHLTDLARMARVKGLDEFLDLYRQSLENPDEFWPGVADSALSWSRRWDVVHRFDEDKAVVEWFSGGLLNAAHNCIDVRMHRKPGRIALVWEGFSGERSILTYEDLRVETEALAAYMVDRGLEPGDRVMLILPAVPELMVAALACARVGIVHCVVEPDLGAPSLAARIRDCAPRLIVTADGLRGSNPIRPLKETVEEALAGAGESVRTVVVVERAGVSWRRAEGRDVSWVEALERGAELPVPNAVDMASEAPLFIRYVNGNTGKNKGLVYTHGGFLVWAAMTSRLILDFRDDDVYWCAMEPSAPAAPAFLLFGPLLNGTTTVWTEQPMLTHDPDAMADLIVRHRVTKLSVDAAAARVFARTVPAWQPEQDLGSLRRIALCNEPVADDVCNWWHRGPGRGRCPVIPAWCQAESGGPLLATLPGVDSVKPGAAGRPLFGVDPLILDMDTGEATRFPNQLGAFFLRKPWPGMARGVFGDHDSYRETYFSPFQSLFLTGEEAKRDDDGHYWFTGRIDDVYTVQGHRVSAWEIETILGTHERVQEVVVVAYPHPIKGHGLYAFVIPAESGNPSDMLAADLGSFVATNLAAYAVPDTFQWASALPKTRSGKILRRILQKIAADEVNNLGDTSTVANPDSIGELIEHRVAVVV